MTPRRASTILWILIRIVLPWIWAMGMLIVRWGKENVVAALLVPFLVILHLYLSSGERPQLPTELQPRRFRTFVAFWHLLDGLSLLALFFFEFTTAMVTELGGGNWWLTFLIVMAIYLFYATLTVAARCFFWKAIRLADEVVADLELNRQSQLQEAEGRLSR